MSQYLAIIFLSLYAILASALTVYGLNCIVMVVLFKRCYTKRLSEQKNFIDHVEVSFWPIVTSQIPVYNEANVVIRVIQAVAKIDYAGHHHIQVLDDSNDLTCALVDAEVKRFRADGVDIEVVRRSDRQGFKAGALAHAHDLAKGEYISVFDADFVPEPDFLRKTVPYFLKSEKLGLIQTRWGHLNEKASILTRIQALGIDGHFMVEQSSRCWNGLYMNFNGTAGIWRKKAIETSGGWSWDTLTEDMDLSYRVQIADWQTEYLPSLVVPAELPEELEALKSQQFRWAKGSTQTALKILPQLWKKDGFSFKLLQAFLHMTHYVVHPLMIMIALLFLPVIHYSQQFELGYMWHSFVFSVLISSIISSNMLYIVSQQAAHKRWLPRLIYLPCLMIVGVGLAVNNTKAVLEALLGHRSDFIRTPKKGDKTEVQYRVRVRWIVVFELILGCYCSLTFLKYLSLEKLMVGPFIAVYASGFLGVGVMTLFQAKRFQLNFGENR